ncbi:MAG: hypothetical protein U9N49_05750, partial [Campylobacterota bacterium]|nr:hypothetical protein [Campylobacterota bacterium]
MKTTRDLTPNTLLPIKIVLWILSIVTLVTAVFFTYEYLNYKKNIYISEKIRLEHLNKNAIDKIEAIVKESMKAADKLANRLTKDKIPKSKMRQTLARMIKSDKHIYGGTITFAPYGYDKNKRLHSDYYSKSGKNGALEYLLLSDLYDYTTADYDWYIEPMQKGNRWGEPYWDEAGRTFMITYSSVFYKKDSQTGKKVPNGVITVDISLEEMKNIIESLNLGNGGFGTLTTKTGRYIYHPNYEYIRLQKNVTEIATEAKDENMLEAIDIMSKNREGVIDYTNPTTKQKSWLFYNSINAGWSLQTTFFLDDLYIDTTTMRQQLIKTITMALFMMITLSVLYILHTLPLTHRKVWFF